MAELVTIKRGKRSRRTTKTGQTTDNATFGLESGTDKRKLPYVVAAVVAALLCLYVAVLHTHSFSGEKELDIAQARIQASHKYNGLKS